MTKNTPVRANSNNYAAPHTPIASVKRPRSSIERSNSSAMRTPMKSPMPSTATVPEDSATNTPAPPAPPPIEPTSPMHPPRPVPKRDVVAPANNEAPVRNVTIDGDAPPAVSSSVEEDEESSASWVGRKVDALFSPVLSFLSSASKDDEDAAAGLGSGGNADDEAAAVTDEDVTMEDTPASSPAVDGTKPSVSEEEDEEEVEDIDHGPMSTSAVAIDQQRLAKADASNGYDHHDDEDEEEFNPYLFIKSLPHYSHVRHLRPPVALPAKDPSSPPITLVLDLDETLVHCTVEQTMDADLTFPVTFNGVQYSVHVKLRPHVFEFLEKVHDKFEVVVFTASQKVYADELLNRIDRQGRFFKHRMFRESCLAVEGNYLKDLTVLGRDMSKMVLVDNSPHAFGYQVDNGIPIESWFDDQSDKELLKLERYLQVLHKTNDVRDSVRETFQTYRKVAES